MGDFGKRPLAYVCYLCGQQYGSQSLHIHIPQCAIKWCQQHEATKAPPPPPELPVTADQLPKGAAAIAAFNAAMMARWDQGSLVKCQHCNRTFRPEALATHSKACTAAKPFKPLPKATSTSSSAEPGRHGPGSLKRTAAGLAAAAEGGAQRPSSNSMAKSSSVVRQGYAGAGGSEAGSPKMPKAYICYLCGQQYGSRSLLIHTPQCQDRWTQQQQQLPAKQQMPLPQPPFAIAEYISGAKPLPTGAALQEFNNIASDFYNRSSLVSCANCGRTFKPEALAHHAKHCTADKPMKR